MVDYDAFSEESFDVQDWVNAAMQSRIEGDSVDTHISTLVMKLQLHAQDIESSIEDGMTQMLASVPRARREISRVESSASALRTDLGFVMQNLSQTEQATHGSVGALSLLHRAKTNMQRSHTTLRQAAEWSATTRQAKALMSSSEPDLNGVVAALAGLQASLLALRTLPGGDGRESELGALKRRMLETTLQPRIVRALGVGDDEALEADAELFKELGEVALLERMYCSAWQQPLHDAWRAFEADGGAEFSEWLPTWWARVAAALDAEGSGRAARIFGGDAAQRVLPSLVVDLLLPLRRSFVDRQSEGLSAPALSTCTSACVRFAAGAMRTMWSAGARDERALGGVVSEATAAAAALVTAPTARTLFSSHFKRSMLDRGMLIGTEGGDEGGKSEERLKIVVELMRQGTSQLLLVGRDALDVCVSILSGISAVNFVAELQQALLRYVSHLAGLLAKCDALVRADLAHDTAGANVGSVEGEGAGEAAGAAAETTPAGAGEGSIFDWPLFSVACELLVQAGDLDARVLELEQVVQVELLTHCQQLLRPPALPCAALRLQLHQNDDNTASVGATDSQNEESAIALFAAQMALTADGKSDNEKSSDQAADTAAALKRLGLQLADTQRRLLPQLANAVADWSSSAQRLIFDAAMGPVQAQLVLFAGFPQWTSASKAEEDGEDDEDDTGDEDDDLPEFGMGPSDYVTQIGEHLLSFLQQLDQFAANSDVGAAATATAGLGAARDVHLRVMSGVLGLSDREHREMTAQLKDSEQENEHETEDGADTEADTNAAAQFSSEWVNAIAQSSSALVIACILKLPRISDTGARQLAVDIGYLTNVMSAVGVSASPLFARLLELFEMSVTEHAAVVQAQVQKPRDATVLLERTLGKARGIGADALC